MGSGATGERVRTYYLPTDEVVDNRTGTRLSWSEFQEGQVPQGYRDALDDDRLLELTAVAPTTTFFLPEVPSRR